MTTPTLSFVERDFYLVLTPLLASMVPAGTEIVRAQVNRVPEPRSNFVEMTTLRRTRLSTNVHTYSDEFHEGGPSVKESLMAVQLDVQLDVHGPAAAENAQVIATLWRDEFSTAVFDGSPIDAEPLFATDATLVPFTNAEDQWENRWVLTISAQLNQVVTTDQDFADTLVVGLIDVDAVYPP